MLGFEVICTFAGDMEDTKKQIPKAIIIGGTVIAPVIILAVSIIFTAVPLSFDAETLSATLPITIGGVIFSVIGELLAVMLGKKKKT